MNKKKTLKANLVELRAVIIESLIDDMDDELTKEFGQEMLQLANDWIERLGVGED